MVYIVCFTAFVVALVETGNGTESRHAIVDITSSVAITDDKDDIMTNLGFQWKAENEMSLIEIRNNWHSKWIKYQIQWKPN